jgi:hypothetical protein
MAERSGLRPAGRNVIEVTCLSTVTGPSLIMIITTIIMIIITIITERVRFFALLEKAASNEAAFFVFLKSEAQSNHG